MSSGFKLMLRPPPHVEFLQGYPGIAPHGERKAALVQGTLEVRGDVKAKWVRVELRKIEVLPGGGQNNTFTETIGERPITLWTSQQEEFSELKSNDFPFHIAVPEAVPPSIALERGAAIKYELIASVMLKGKKSLWKRDPAPISTYSSPIVIEKHDLLQCWPIYHQQQTRQASANGVTLIANFPQTGFGPGDVVPVEAILRADVPGTGAVLRAYELTVRETLIFRSSPPTVPQHNHPHLHMHSQQPQRRVPAAQTRSNIISDQKVPVPVQVFPGSQHRCDLGCQIPLAQTNVSVRTARHIEVNYIVQVKAVLASNAVVSVELPVTITNWQRQASQDAMHRIGYAPELSGPAPPVPGPGLNLNLFQATNPAASPAPTQNGRPTSSGAGSHSIPERVSRRSTGVESPGRNTLGAPGAGMGEQIDELGYVPAHAQQAQTMPGRTPASGYGSSQGGSAQGGRRPGSSSGPSEPDDFGSPGPLANNTPALRPPNPNRRSVVQRFTVVNADQEEGAKPLSAEEEKRRLKEKYANQDRKRRESDTGGSKPAANGNANGNGRGAWPSAEDEKQRLYDSARRTATKTQQSAGHEVELPESAGGSSSTPPQRWPTAEEEKRRLFDGARQAAVRTQGTTYETSLPYAQDEPKVEQDKKEKQEAFAGGWAFSAGGPAVAPYGDNKPAVPYASSPPAEQGYPPAEPKTEARPAPQQWLSAADEKRMLFEKARAAAERTQSLAVNSMEGNGNTSSSSAPYSTPSPYGTNSTTPYSTNSNIPSQYGGSNSTFPDRVSSPISTLSHGHGVGTPGAGKTGEELFAAGLAAMGRQSMYPAQSPASSYLGAHAQATPPPRVPSPPSNAVPGYGSSSSAPGYGSGSSLSHSQSMRYPSAAEEKASLYMAAKQRVEQAHAQAGLYGNDNGYADAPSSPNGIPGYDTLYGPAPTVPAPEPVQAPAVRPLSVQRRTPSASGSPPAIHSTPPAFNAADLPPGFTPNPGPTASALSALEEKARLRRQYEDQDAAAAGSTLSPTAGPPPRASPPPPAFQPSPTYGTSAQDEKERMRRMYAEQDAAVRTNERRATNDSGRRPTLPTPPRAGSLLPSPGYETNGNEPPPFAGGFINPATFKPLSAAEEKARLRAQYEAETNGTAYNPGQGSSFDPPPPSFDSHYPPPERQNTYVPPDRNGTTTPGEGRGLQRDPSVSWGKRPATQTPVPEAQLSRSASTFVAPPPPPPLMPKPPAAYIQETLAANQHNDWDRSRSPTPDLYDEPLRSPPLPGPNAPAVPAKPIE